jgi:hypothetical protein
MISFSVILVIDPTSIAIITTGVIGVAGIIASVVTFYFRFKQSEKRDRQQDKQHEEKMKLTDTKIEIQRLQLLKAISTLDPNQEKKLKKLLSLKEDLETKIKLI